MNLKMLLKFPKKLGFFSFLTEFPEIVLFSLIFLSNFAAFLKKYFKQKQNKGKIKILKVQPGLPTPAALLMDLLLFYYSAVHCRVCVCDYRPKWFFWNSSDLLSVITFIHCLYFVTCCSQVFLWPLTILLLLLWPRFICFLWKFAFTKCHY